MKRRDFISTAATAVASTLAFPRLMRSADSPANKVNVAFIGVGGQGRGAVFGQRAQNYIAFCDVDDTRAARAYGEFPEVPRFKDWRVMFDKLGREIEAVVISTPDHTHCAAALAAMERGKHVYVEKPMARTIQEVRWMHAAAQKNRIVSQMGIQGHTAAGMRLAREWIDAGVIGPVTDVYLWTDRPNPRDTHDFEKTYAPAEPVPGDLAWDLWLGPAHDRPFSKVYAPTSWRGWWDLGAGSLGNIAIHMWDVVEFVLEPGFPDLVETAETERIARNAVPRWSSVRYKHPARGSRPPVTVHWFSGIKGGVQFHPKNLPFWPAEREMGTNGIAFAGASGLLFFPDMRASSRPFVFPEPLWQDFQTRIPAPTLVRAKGSLFDDFFRAIREGRKGAADFDYAAPLTETVLLGNLALRTGKPIKWDRKKMRADGVPEADALLSPYIRKGWEFPV